MLVDSAVSPPLARRRGGGGPFSSSSSSSAGVGTSLSSSSSSSSLVRGVAVLLLLGVLAVAVMLHDSLEGPHASSPAAASPSSAAAAAAASQSAGSISGVAVDPSVGGGVHLLAERQAKVREAVRQQRAAEQEAAAEEAALFGERLCRNTVQGAELLADDAGFVCRRGAVDPLTGCCPTPPEAKKVGAGGGSEDGDGKGGDGTQVVVVTPPGEVSRRFTCAQPACVAVHQCCALFEHCVSCCLAQSPEAHAELSRVMSRRAPLLFGGGGPEAVAQAVADPFPLCTRRCRTSSESVVHENAYRSEELKHCYGPDEPPLQRKPV